MKEIGRVSCTLSAHEKPPTDVRHIQFTCLNFLEGLEGFSVAPFTRILGWSREEVDIFLAQTRSETLKRSIHGWQKGYVAGLKMAGCFLN